MLFIINKTEKNNFTNKKEEISMRSFFSASVNIMSRLTFTRKLVVITVLFAIPLAVSLYSLLASQQVIIKHGKNEKVGIELYYSIQKTLVLVAEHRGKFLGFISGKTNSREQVLALEKEIQAKMVESLKIAQPFQDKVNTLSFLNRHVEHIKDLSIENADKDMPIAWYKGTLVGSARFLDAHTKLIGMMTNDYTTLKTDFDLAIDSDAINSLIINILTEYLPPFRDVFNRYADIAKVVAEAKAFSPENFTQLNTLNIQARESSAQFQERLALLKLDGNLELKLAEVTTALDKLTKTTNTFFDTIYSEIINTDEITIDVATVEAQMNVASTQIKELRDIMLSILNSRIEANVNQLERNVAIVLFSGIAGVFLAFYFISGFYIGIKESLGALRACAQKLAQGDLTARAAITSKDEMRDITDSFNNVADAFERAVGTVAISVNQLNQSAEEINRASSDLSNNANQAAASVEETSASIEEIVASINQNAKSAKTTETIAAKANSNAQKGGEAVRRTIEAMKQIASKIQVIDDIAHQTNLLALNAAIESARAGQHGRGFAVVATEVRKLAEHSRVAAEEIATMASNSVGVATDAGNLLGEIVPGVAETSDLVREIAQTSDEQAISVNQISQAVSRVDQVTQRTASASEELNATSQNIVIQAGQLTKLVSSFTFNSSKNNAA